MEEDFQVWGVPAGDIPFQPILLGTYYTQSDAETAVVWLTAGRAWTNLHIRHNGPLFEPEVKP